MMSNDDFIFQDSIFNQIKFLDNNPDYSASRGDVFDFAINSLNKKINFTAISIVFLDYSILLAITAMMY